MYDPILITAAAAVMTAAKDCSNEIRGILPWAESDWYRWNAVAPNSISKVWGKGESWLFAGEERRAEVNAAAKAAREAFRRHEAAFVDALNPANRIAVGAQASPFGGEPDVVYLHDLRRGLFGLAVKTEFRPDDTLAGGRSMKQELLNRLQVFAGAADYSLFAK